MDANAAAAASLKNAFPGSCVMVPNAKCDAIRDLAFYGDGATDSEGYSIDAKALHDYYACPHTQNSWGPAKPIYNWKIPPTCTGASAVSLTNCGAASSSSFSPDLVLVVQ